jgi:hypothetical protein
VSEVRHDAPTFFSLYADGRISADQIDDFVEAWHQSGDDETRSLAEYLGMTDDEYAVWVMSHAALPTILASRRLEQPLAEAVANYLRELRQSHPANQAAILALQHWLHGQAETAAKEA